MKIYPSLISADLLNLEAVITQFNDLCDGFHIDIMDGHFVPNITWGPAFSNAIAKKTGLPLDIHLMVSDPTGVAARLTVRMHDCITFHYEAVTDAMDIMPIITHIKNMGCRVGIAINPATPAAAITQYLNKIDSLTIMSVNPGASGQPFIQEVFEKITQLGALKQEINPHLSLMVDGGVNEKNIAMLAQAGVNSCGIAAAIFSAQSPVDAIKHLYKLAS